MFLFAPVSNTHIHRELEASPSSKFQFGTFYKERNSDSIRNPGPNIVMNLSALEFGALEE